MPGRGLGQPWALRTQMAASDDDEGEGQDTGNREGEGEGKNLDWGY